MLTTVLPQLVEVESLLSAQETALMQQLTKIREQRKGLQTVIAMFDAAETVAENIDVDNEAVEAPTATQLAQVTAEKAIAHKSKAAKSRQTKTPRKSTQEKKMDGRTAYWQRYILDNYRQQRLPDVVANRPLA